MDSITVKVNDLWAVLNLMKKDGMSISLIAKYTGLTEEEIKIL